MAARLNWCSPGWFYRPWRVCAMLLCAHAAAGYTLPASTILRDGAMFDYIVVGAGAAGAAAASRLSLAGAEVLLVEAGGNPSLISRTPGVAMGLIGSFMDWQYLTVPNNKSCLSSQGKQCRFARGKCLGGSTSINYMLYTRGSRQDYDDIDVPGWSWADLKPYFLKYEGLQDLDSLPKTSIPYHNTTGTMKMEHFGDSGNPWHGRLIDGFKTLGFPYNPDVNALSQIGVSVMAGYVYEGSRMSTARGYLSRRDVKATLKVAKNTYCTGVIIDEHNVARGITVLQNLRSKKIYARKEVILSAGAIGSPHILLLSGIGPTKHLEEMDIKVRADLPVGDDMSDHVSPLLIGLVDRGGSLKDDLEIFTELAEELSELLLTRSGPLTTIGLTDVSSFVNTDCYNVSTRVLERGPGCELPNFQLIHSYIDRSLIRLGKRLFQDSIGLDDEAVDQIAEANSQYGIIIFTLALLKPYSRGYVRLASNNPEVPPTIFPNYLADDRDVDQMLDAVKIIEDLLETPPLSSNNAKLFRMEFGDCPQYSAGEWRAYWRCYVRHMTYAVFHAVGPCALGRVVDARLRVRGVRGLRVADIGVLPVLPRGNTAAVGIAIGERVAHFIAQEHGHV